MTAKPTKPQPMFWLGDARGVYIPRDFAASFADRAKQVRRVNDEDWTILEAGPDHEDYWDTWCTVLDSARITDEDGVVYNVHQDGDVWLIPDGMEFSEVDDWFVWPE